MSLRQLGNRLIIYLLLGILVTGIQSGCNRRASDTLPSRQSSASQIKSTDTTNPLRDPTARNLAVPRLTSRTIAETPPIGEWETERLNELASRQFKKLGTALTGQVPTNAFEELITQGSTANSMFTAAATECFRDEQIVVKRVKPDSTPDGIASEPVKDLRVQLSILREANSWQRYKFKIIRIDRQADSRFRTQAYAHLDGRSHSFDSVIEMNATWTVDWHLETNGHARIQSITSSQFELVTAQGQTLFTDITAAVLGNPKTYEQTILPSIATLRERIENRLGVYNLGHHGIAISDINGDDRPDAYVCQTGGLPNHLFVQNTDGTVTDIAQAANVDYLDNTRAALFVDLDNDNDQDLVLTMSTGMLILENDGNAEFRERARIRSVKEGFSLASADFNDDGLLDIYVCVYYGSGATISELPAPFPYFDAKNGGENHLVFNEGDWRFRDGTKDVGLNEDNSRFSYAAAWDDFDSDGDQDLLVVNDFGPNQLYRNTDGKFSNCAAEVGLIDGAFGMSASFGDYNRDGQSDIYIGNMFSAAGNRITTQEKFKRGTDESIRKKFLHLARGNSLFTGKNGHFSDVSVPSGVTVGRWSWGSVFADVNNDGWEDILVGNGYVTGKSKDDL